MVITSSLNKPSEFVHVILIFASVGKSVGGVYVAALTSNNDTVMAPIRAPIPARVGVPSLTKRGNAVSLMRLSCISFNNSLYAELLALFLGAFFTESRSKEAALRYSARESFFLAMAQVASPAIRNVVALSPLGSTSLSKSRQAEALPLG